MSWKREPLHSTTFPTSVIVALTPYTTRVFVASLGAWMKCTSVLCEPCSTENGSTLVSLKQTDAMSWSFKLLFDTDRRVTNATDESAAATGTLTIMRAATEPGVFDPGVEFSTHTCVQQARDDDHYIGIVHVLAEALGVCVVV